MSGLHAGEETGGADAAGDVPYSAGEADAPGILYVVNESGGDLDGLFLAECGGDWGSNELDDGPLPDDWYLTLLDIPLGCYDVLVVDVEGYFFFPDVVFSESDFIWTLTVETYVVGDDDDATDDDDDATDDDDFSNDDDAADDDDTSDCPSGEVEDCAGNCASTEYLGNGECDDGSEYPEDFDCAEFDFDDGDCEGGDDDDAGDDDDTGEDLGTLVVVNDTLDVYLFDDVWAEEASTGETYDICFELESGDSCQEDVPAGYSYNLFAYDEVEDCWMEEPGVAVFPFQTETWTIDAAEPCL